MRISDIIFCSLIGICNYVILREVFTYGLGRILAQGPTNPRVRTAVFIGLFLFIAGGVVHRMTDFNPDMKSLLNWSLVFIFPLVLAFLTKGKLDAGWSSLEQGKALWRSLYPRLTYEDGIVAPPNSELKDDPAVVRAKNLIKQSVEFAAQSNVDGTLATVNTAIAWQELGLLHRAINEFQEAEEAFRKSLGILEKIGGGDSDNRDVLAAYRETIFRLGELYHVTSKRREAKEYYLRSLSTDAKLGHDDPRGERATRNLLTRIEESGKPV